MKEAISKELFEIIVCPVCKADLAYNKDHSGLVCTKCGAKYPIEDGIPILLPPELQK